MVNKQVKKSENRFSKVFIKNDENLYSGRQKWLTEYLSVAKDEYMSRCLNRLIQGLELTVTDCERVDDLMANVDLNLLFVDNLLRGDEDISEHVHLMSPIESRIVKIMQVGKGRLSGWEEKFIFGDDGEALLSQARNRNGWLSDKQILQVERIEKILGIERK